MKLLNNKMNEDNVSNTAVPARSAHTSLKRARILFSNCSGISKESLLVPRIDGILQECAMARKRAMLYPDLSKRVMNDPRKGTMDVNSTALTKVGDNSHGNSDDVSLAKNNDRKLSEASMEGAIVLSKNAKKGKSSVKIPTPKWHAPWRLSTVISAHLGWVRSIAFDPTTNDIFATGGADNVIKIFDTAKACVGADDALKLTLTGHISPVRALAFSERHPYLFSAGEDKMVKVS